MSIADRRRAAFRLGIVTGLREEERVLRDALAAAGGTGAIDHTEVRCDGPGPDAARRAAEALLSTGARALMSIGLAGGCDPALPTGTAVIATGVRDLAATGTLWTNREWRGRLQGLLLGAVLVEEAAIGTSARAVVGADSKQTLFWSDGVACVDMESAAVAHAAVAADVPFMALRIIVDPADFSLPGAALAALQADGSLRPAAAAAAAIRRPAEIPALLRLGNAHRRAIAALHRAAAAGAPMFGAV